MNDKMLRPGERLREELGARGWTQGQLAQIMGRPQGMVGEIISGARSITPRTAHELAAALGIEARVWLDLESAYQLAQATETQDESITKRARIFQKAPVNEMVRRGWIEPTKDPDELERRLLEFFDLGSLAETPQLWGHASRKSTSYESVTPAQWAWLFRARQLAQTIQVQDFTPAKLDSSLERMRLLLHSPQEIRHVPTILAEAGVRLVIVEPLSGSKIDGACFWLDAKSPVVAVSLRYDRIDFFWHTLMHELGHVRASDGLNDDSVPLDVELVGGEKSKQADRPQKEKEADDFAASFLVDRHEMEDFMIRVGPLYSRTRILGFSKRLQVHPGIVVGQLQFLGELSYANFRSMLAKVRKTVTGAALTDGWGFAVANGEST